MYSSLLKSFFSLPLSFPRSLLSGILKNTAVISIIHHSAHLQTQTETMHLTETELFEVTLFQTSLMSFSLYPSPFFLQWGQEERRTDNMEWFRGQGFSESISHVWSYLGSSHFPYQQGGWFTSSSNNKSSGNRSNLPQFLSHLSPRSQADLRASPLE